MLSGGGLGGGQLPTVAGIRSRQGAPSQKCWLARNHFFEQTSSVFQGLKTALSCCLQLPYDCGQVTGAPAETLREITFQEDSTTTTNFKTHKILGWSESHFTHYTDKHNATFATKCALDRKAHKSTTTVCMRHFSDTCPHHIHILPF